MALTYKLPWQEGIFKELTQRSNFPQSLLIYGPQGIGKLALALRVSNFLLCESTGKLKPCNECSACKWFAAGNHPDFIGVLPEDMQDQLPHDSQMAIERESSEEKKLSKFIKIDQIREALLGIGLATYRGGKKILLINPVESMQVAASNSLLKALEEPPENTIFILITNQLDQVLPTIRSRCRLLGLNKPTLEESLDWFLISESSKEFTKEKFEQALRESSGAPFLALNQLINGQINSTKEILLNFLPLGKNIDWLTASEQLSKFPIIDSIIIIQRWIFDLTSLIHTGKVKYYPGHLEQLNRLNISASDLKLIKFSEECMEARRRSNHALTTKLQLENLFLRYSKIFN